MIYIRLDNFWIPPVWETGPTTALGKTTTGGLSIPQAVCDYCFMPTIPRGRFWVSRPPFPGTSMRAESGHKQVPGILFTSMGDKVIV